MNEILQAMAQDITQLTMAERLIGSLLVAAIAITTVFAVLALLIGVLELMNRLLRPKQEPSHTVAPPTPRLTEEAPATPEPSPDELVVIITAALASVIDAEHHVHVTRIRRSGEDTPIWARTGRQEQILPPPPR